MQHLLLSDTAKFVVSLVCSVALGTPSLGELEASQGTMAVQVGTGYLVHSEVPISVQAIATNGYLNSSETPLCFVCTV